MFIDIKDLFMFLINSVLLVQFKLGDTVPESAYLIALNLKVSVGKNVKKYMTNVLLVL